MKRTGAASLIVAAVLGGGAGYLFDQLLTSAGRPTFTPQISLPILLVALGVIVVLLALPIRRATQGKADAPVNPFHAVRIAMLAKASSLVGAVFTGVSLGLLLFLLTRPAEPSVGSLGALIGTAVGAVLLLVGGLIAEHLCTIRKDDDDKHPGAGSGAGGVDDSDTGDTDGHYAAH
ncbi:DUF3180 domain-containing protein [Microbacterium horticulturae]|uniref:DUF3180 domain-containing protein n=1 Tax=Microbacterium horticulturae TaxID=3028316 RepID=A0ABY8BZ50_9MICO|nr:DUF3180 domain-containing protein [Microbacterium sp. KACC 23027]WEG09215.1 DUF3180 domain-containing protein [Microbacterium sp. KACC 23027]